MSMFLKFFGIVVEYVCLLRLFNDCLLIVSDVFNIVCLWVLILRMVFILI